MPNINSLSEIAKVKVDKHSTKQYTADHSIQMYMGQFSMLRNDPGFSTQCDRITLGSVFNVGKINLCHCSMLKTDTGQFSNEVPC